MRKTTKTPISIVVLGQGTNLGRLEDLGVKGTVILEREGVGWIGTVRFLKRWGISLRTE
jgi:hypothetical protein